MMNKREMIPKGGVFGIMEKKRRVKVVGCLEYEPKKKKCRKVKKPQGFLERENILGDAKRERDREREKYPPTIRFWQDLK